MLRRLLPQRRRRSSGSAARTEGAHEILGKPPPILEQGLLDDTSSTVRTNSPPTASSRSSAPGAAATSPSSAPGAASYVSVQAAAAIVLQSGYRRLSAERLTAVAAEAAAEAAVADAAVEAAAAEVERVEAMGSKVEPEPEPPKRGALHAQPRASDDGAPCAVEWPSSSGDAPHLVFRRAAGHRPDERCLERHVRAPPSSAPPHVAGDGVASAADARGPPHLTYIFNHTSSAYIELMDLDVLQVLLT
jgi:hypothetical protein